MTTLITIILVAFLLYIVWNVAFDKGYKNGEQDGRLDQHWYQQRVAQKTKRRRGRFQ